MQKLEYKLNKRAKDGLDAVRRVLEGASAHLTGVSMTGHHHVRVEFETSDGRIGVVVMSSTPRTDHTDMYKTSARRALKLASRRNA